MEWYHFIANVNGFKMSLLFSAGSLHKFDSRYQRLSPTDKEVLRKSCMPQGSALGPIL